MQPKWFSFRGSGVVGMQCWDVRRRRVLQLGYSCRLLCIPGENRPTAVGVYFQMWYAIIKQNKDNTIFISCIYWGEPEQAPH